MPELNTSGKRRKALVWYFLSLTTSAVTVLMMLTLPFARPARTLQNNSVPKDLDSPNPMFAMTEISRPPRMERRLPCLSEKRPHGRLMMHWAKGNAATRRPEYSEIRADEELLLSVVVVVVVSLFEAESTERTR